MTSDKEGRPLLKIHNDGKKKAESWEARLDLDSSNVRAAGFVSLSAIGYGANEGEAIDELKTLLGRMTTTVQDLDYTTREMVTWYGKPIVVDVDEIETCPADCGEPGTCPACIEPEEP